MTFINFNIHMEVHKIHSQKIFYLVWILLAWTNIWTVLTIVNVVHGPSYLLQRTDFGPYFVYWYHPIELFYIGLAFSTDDRVSHYISRPWRFFGSSENMNYFLFSSCSVVFIRMYSSNVSSGKLELLFIRIKYYVIIQYTYYFIIFSIQLLLEQQFKEAISHVDSAYCAVGWQKRSYCVFHIT